MDRFQRKHIGLSKSLSFAESFDKIIRNSENFVRISETLSQLRINNGSMQRIFSSLEWLSTIFLVFPQWFYSGKPQAKRLFIPHDQHFAILPKYHNTSKKYSEVSFIFTRAENLTVSWRYKCQGAVEICAIFLRGQICRSLSSFTMLEVICKIKRMYKIKFSMLSFIKIPSRLKYLFKVRIKYY